MSYPGDCEDAADGLSDDQRGLGTSHRHIQQVPLIVRNINWARKRNIQSIQILTTFLEGLQIYLHLHCEKRKDGGQKKHTEGEVGVELQVVLWGGNLGEVIGDHHSVELQTFSLVDRSDYEVWNKTATLVTTWLSRVHYTVERKTIHPCEIYRFTRI